MVFSRPQGMLGLLHVFEDGFYLMPVSPEVYHSIRSSDMYDRKTFPSSRRSTVSTAGFILLEAISFLISLILHPLAWRLLVDDIFLAGGNPYFVGRLVIICLSCFRWCFEAWFRYLSLCVAFMYTVCTSCWSSNLITKRWSTVIFCSHHKMDVRALFV